jgi:hypothetical protein
VVLLVHANKRIEWQFLPVENLQNCSVQLKKEGMGMGMSSEEKLFVGDCACTLKSISYVRWVVYVYAMT